MFQKVLVIILVPLLFNTLCPDLNIGQTLLLPAPAGSVRGKGLCSSMVVGIYSENWRVRKGDVFDVQTTGITTSEPGLHYNWTVSNGKIVSGQGTAAVRIKAGGAKTPGYINAGGFVKVGLAIRRAADGADCEVSAAASIMVGRHRESDMPPHVESLTIDRDQIQLPCTNAPDAGSRLAGLKNVQVSVVAKDPENDVLHYSYSVSGGKVVGNGSQVVWDLSGLGPGTYTIVAGADDGMGIRGKIQSSTITLLSCRS